MLTAPRVEYTPTCMCVCVRGCDARNYKSCATCVLPLLTPHEPGSPLAHCGYAGGLHLLSSGALLCVTLFCMSCHVPGCPSSEWPCPGVGSLFSREKGFNPSVHNLPRVPCGAFPNPKRDIHLSFSLLHLLLGRSTWCRR